MIIDNRKAQHVTLLVREVGEKLITLWKRNKERDDALLIEKKADNSLVSEADFASNAILITGLSRLFSGVPIVSEEGVHQDEKDSDYKNGYWLIDPLDGTKEFLEGRDNFAVLVAYIDSEMKPAAGWVYFPVKDQLFAACSGRLLDDSAPVSLTPKIDKNSVYYRLDKREPVKNEFLAGEGLHSGEAFQQFFQGNISGCLLELGRLGTWDIAAPAAVVLASGGEVVGRDGSDFRFSANEDQSSGDQSKIDSGTAIILGAKELVPQLTSLYNEL